MSGRWQDDPKNWGRAFHSTKPPDVVVVHSEYWRSPHWSYEAAYLFEVRPTPALRDQLFTQNRLLQVPTSDVGDLHSLCFASCPAWFAPGSADLYDVWAYADEPHSNFRIVIDKHTGTMFLVDYQV